MKRMKTVGTWVGAIAITVMSAACSGRAEDNAADAARETREAAQDAARTTGEAADDAATTVGGALDNAGRAADAAVETMDVKAALIADTRVDASNVNVDTNHDTRTVVLKGAVPTAAQKTLAEQIATRQATGYKVQNNLTVGAVR